VSQFGVGVESLEAEDRRNDEDEGRKGEWEGVGAKGKRRGKERWGREGGGVETHSTLTITGLTERPRAKKVNQIIR
jgi:hypothetical protein